MAKSAKQPNKRSAKQPDFVPVRYDLHDLPTAQHKAGLAGLLLQIESMNERREHGVDLREPPRVLNAGPAHAEVRFTPESMQALFDDLYAADKKAVWVNTKRKKKNKIIEPLSERQVEDNKTGKKKSQYEYEVVEPAGPFLARYTDDGKEIWHKLWRNMLWAIPRGIPKTRGPFNARAAGEPTKDGAVAWKRLVDNEKAKKKRSLRTVEVAGAILLGAQALSAESVKFEDRADHALLLHFWQLTTRVFVPARIEQDKKTKEWRENFVGFVLTVPEVSDLCEFTTAFKRGLLELCPKPNRFRPAEAVVSLAAQGSLAFMHQLDRIASAKVLGRRPPEYLSGVEYFHMVKPDKRVLIAAHGRVPAWNGLLMRYDGLMSKGGPKNLIMLAGRLRALMDGAPWFARLSDELVQREWSWFVHSRQEKHETPWVMIGFASEADRRFGELEQNYIERKEAGLSTPSMQAEVVDRVIYRIINEYVHRHAASRCGVPDDHRGYKHEKTHNAAGRELGDYQEQRRHVASKLFLRLRSCAGDDFVQQLTLNISSVSQFLQEDDYLVLSAALMRTFTDEYGEDRPRTRDDVKTLALLALSAHSRSLAAKSNDAPTDADAQAGGDAGKETER